MSEASLEFRRPFQLWLHVVSHRNLLLRSVKSPAESTRVDILFHNVRAIQIPTLMDSLRIGIESTESLEQACANFGVHATADCRLYSLRSDNFSGFIIANDMTSHVDALEYGDPSFFASALAPILGL
jgi:hypothetical protein